MTDSSGGLFAVCYVPTAQSEGEFQSLQVIATAAALPIYRGDKSDGMTYMKGFDATIGHTPIVFLEETAEGPVGVPQQEVAGKLAWIPHYRHLGVLVGIGIAGDKAVFFKYTEVQGIEAQAKYDLSTLSGRGR